VIHHTLQHATLARGARKIEIINIGLEPWEGLDLGLPVEKVPVRYTKDGQPIRRPVGEYVRARTDRAPNGETWEEWLQHSRIELNAFTSAQLIAWLDRKMAEHGAGKVIPPDDVLRNEFDKRVRGQVENAVAKAIKQRVDGQITTIEAARAEAARLQREEMARTTAPLRELLALVEAPFLGRIALLEAPFEKETAEARAAAEAIDQAAKTERVIEQITPDGETLTTAINKAFSDGPTLRWLSVLQEIAEEAEADLNDTVQAVVGDAP
jgi:hypothetical protein